MRVLIDMDGVLFDFVSAACAAHGVSESKINWAACGFDMYEGLGLSVQEFWAEIDAKGESFWSDMELYPWAKALLKSIRQICGDNFYFCSTPSWAAQSSSGKILALQKNFPLHSRRFVLTPHKHLLANSETVLIDDSDTNVQNFTAAGGEAILFPQPWNLTKVTLGGTSRLNYTLSKLKQLQLRHEQGRL